MSTVETLRCDECGKLRVNDSNHWLCGAFDAKSFVVISPLGMLPVEAEDEIVHLCGQECAMKWVAVKIGEL